MKGIEKYRHIIIFGFFAALLLTGIFTYDDFGLSWDERSVHDENGIINYNFIVTRDAKPLLEGNEKYHGPAFEILLIWLEKKCGLTDMRDIYLMRHLVTFLLFFVAVIFFFFLCKKYFNSWKAGMAGVLMLVLCPRIFADAFYNSKDLAFLSVFIISMFTHFLFLRKRNLSATILHAVTTGVLIAIRVMGVMMPVFLLITLMLEYFNKNTERKKNPAANSLVYLLLFPFIMILCWPVMWLDAWHHFKEAFAEMSRYHWDAQMLFNGHLVNSMHLPWNYIPQWIGLTIPDFFLLLFFFGTGAMIFSLVTRPKKFLTERTADVTILLWFFVPVLSVIFLHSVVYDAWRHLFFIYPALIIIALSGARIIYKKYLHHEGIFRNKILRWLAVSIVLLGFAEPTISTIKNYPFGNVYFNLAARMKYKEVRKNFEMDYWGLSYRKGLEYILQNDTSSVIRFYSTDEPGYTNSVWLPKRELARLKYAGRIDDADYFLTTCRAITKDYQIRNEVFNVKSQGEKILFVYKFNRTGNWMEEINHQHHDFEDADSMLYHARSGDVAFGGKYSSKSDSARNFTDGFDYVLPDLKNKIATIHFRAMIYCASPHPDARFVISSERDEKSYDYRQLDVVKEMQEPKKWFPMEQNITLPVDAKAGDHIKCYVWNLGKDAVYADDIDFKLVGYNF